MKLKYILPVATIASVASAVTPLAVSCSCSGWGYSWDYKTKGEYKFKFEKLAPGSLSVEQATNKYFEALEKDKGLLADDYLCYMNRYMGYIDDPGTTTNSAIAKMNINSIDTNKHLISVDLFRDIDITIPDEDPIKSFVDIQIKNIKWMAYSDGDVSWPDFIVCPTSFNSVTYDEAIEELDKQDGWSIKGEIISGEEYHITFDFNSNKKPTTDDEGDALLGAIVGCHFDSNYLSDITLDK